MDRYYAEKIELNDLAAAAFMSRFHYVRMFQQMYGLTPRVYLRDLRIAKAKALLIEGLPITQVCFDIGYESLPTFSAAFKSAPATRRVSTAGSTYAIRNKFSRLAPAILKPTRIQ